MLPEKEPITNIVQFAPYQEWNVGRCGMVNAAKITLNYLL